MMETKRLWTGKIIISKMITKIFITYYHFIDLINPVKRELSYKRNDDLTNYEIRIIKRNLCPDCGRKLSKQSIDYYFEYKCPKSSCKSLFWIYKKSILTYSTNIGIRKTKRKTKWYNNNNRIKIKKILPEFDTDQSSLEEEKSQKNQT